VLTSTNTFGGTADLDLRPPEMHRSTMDLWLQECRSCGYVAVDLSEDGSEARETVASDAYRALDPADPSKALIGRFLKRALLDEGLGRTGDAAEHVLCAAWAADDAADRSAAEYRSRAADLFVAAASALPEGSDEAVKTRARTVDMLRRAGRWAEAVALADAMLSGADLGPTVRSVVAFGRDRARARQGGRYTVADAVPASAPAAPRP
jgi:hypothetical protein